MKPRLSRSLRAEQVEPTYLISSVLPHYTPFQIDIILACDSIPHHLHPAESHHVSSCSPKVSSYHRPLASRNLSVNAPCREYHIVVLGSGTYLQSKIERCENSWRMLGGVGKSCLTGKDKNVSVRISSSANVMLAAQFVQGVWIERYDPTIEDSYRKQIDVDVRLSIV